MTSKPDAVAVVEVKQSGEEPAPKRSVLQWWKRNWRNLLSEFVSTFSLLFFGCMSCLPLDGYEITPPIYGAIGFGLVVLINVQTFGHLSGAHMNPSVTLASVLWGQTPPVLGFIYLIIQCLGATCGYWLLVTLSPSDVSTGFCVTQPKTGLMILQAFGIEVMLTTALIFLCCCLWDPVNKDKLESVAIKFGMAIIGLSICGGPLTGASMNPARSLGPAIVSGNYNALWIYCCGPFLGALVALFVYKYIWLVVEDAKSLEVQPLNG